MNLRVKLGLLVTVAMGATVLGLNGFPGTVQPTNTIVAQAATTINAQHQGMVGNAKTVNNEALQDMLDKWDSDDLTVHVPKGTYVFDAGNSKLHSNITFKFDKGAVFWMT